MRSKANRRHVGAPRANAPKRQSGLRVSAPLRRGSRHDSAAIQPLPNPEKVRLQKFLADAGVASRRACEQIILDGRVTVNGQEVRELGTKVHPTADHILLDGRPVRPRRKLYIALNKPPGYICTRNDPEQRRTIGELLPREWQHLYSVGRLDHDD